MEGRYGFYSQGNSRWGSFRNEEFQEEDVWNVFREGKDFTSTIDSSEFSTVAPRRLPTAARMIPRANNTNTTQEPKVVQQSAPVTIPDWSKIYQKSPKKGSKNISWINDGEGDSGGGDGGRDELLMRGSWDSDEDDGEDSDGTMVPPHEWLARRLARSQISSFSVCEGAGRTLKGRDLSRVRNAVLTKTGFLE
ncbi:hypothetical protein NMG60_11037272 [Bertholletia excelsa]